MLLVLVKRLKMLVLALHGSVLMRLRTMMIHLRCTMTKTRVTCRIGCVQMNTTDRSVVLSPKER